MRGWCNELTKGERELIVKSQILAITSTSAHTKRSTQRCHSPLDRQREYASYLHQGLRVCLDTFLFLQTIKRGTFKALKRNCRKNVLVSRVHGNTWRAPKHALSFEECCPSLQTKPRNTPSSFQVISLDTRDRTWSSCHVPPPGVQCGISTTMLPPRSLMFEPCLFPLSVLCGSNCFQVPSLPV